MSYTNNDILKKAELLSGESLSTESAEILETMCSAAASELERRLRSGVSSESLGELFVTASGMLALALYMELCNSGMGDVSAFKAGNISVNFREGSGGSSAASLRKAAESLLSSYLEGEGFGFVGVDG